MTTDSLTSHPYCRHQKHGRTKRQQDIASGWCLFPLICLAQGAAEHICYQFGSMRLSLVQAGHICRRLRRSQLSCRAIVAPTSYTNGAALGTGKPILDNPLWRDTFQPESHHSTAAQLLRQPKTILPNRLRLFAGTANPVCFSLDRIKLNLLHACAMSHAMH